MKNGVRLAYVQYGDFRETSENFDRGLPETYHAQKYSVDFVEKQAKAFQHVSVLCVNATKEYSDFELPSGVYTHGLDLYAQGKPRWNEVIDILQRVRPTHLIMRTPGLPVINWGIKNKIKQYLSLADSFYPPSNPLKRIRDKYWRHRLIKSLNHPSVEWVSNHNIAASEQLVEMGISPDKVIPYDFPRAHTPEDYAEKKLPDTGKFELLYIGSVSMTKGVGDIISALASDKNLQNIATLKIAGGGDIDTFKQQVAESNLSGCVEFLGRVDFPEVAALMRASDVVLAPSWHEYSEGLPGTIYEALGVRTPIIISDHPIFLKYFSGNGDVIICPEKSPDKIANALRDLLDNKELYAALSHNAVNTFQHILHPVMWADPIRLWLDENPEARAELKKLTLADFHSDAT